MRREIHELTKLDQPPRVMTGGRAAASAVTQGLSVPVVDHCDQVLAVIERLLAAPRSPSVISPALAARVPLRAPSGLIAAEQLDTIPAAFSAPSLAAADSVRESARRAFEMERLAYRDPLTGLFNRRAFDERIAAITEHELLQGALALIDVDKFKQINDTHGHQTGDQTLVAVGRAMRSAPENSRPGSAATSSSCSCPPPRAATLTGSRNGSRPPSQARPAARR